MKCKDCRYSEVPRDVLDTSTEVIFCPRFGQYRAAECERSCDGTPFGCVVPGYYCLGSRRRG